VVAVDHKSLVVLVVMVLKMEVLFKEVVQMVQ
jgi:hypothetical protein